VSESTYNVDIQELSKEFLDVRLGASLPKNVYLVYSDIDSFHGLP